MTQDANRQDLLLGVIGAGAMGRGIAQVAAVGGCDVLLFDAQEGAAQAALDFVASMLNRAAEKGRMEEADAKAAIARISVAADIEAFAPCNAVIEAIIEDLGIKRGLFETLEGIIAPDAILASNTSSLSVTSLAANCAHPERFAGFHFFNPVPLMKLVEVIKGLKTAQATADFLFDLGKRMGREPVHVGDAPGFLVNQVGRGFNIEASHAVTDRVTGFVDVDRIMRDSGGFRMGPFELLDLTALDVTHPATIAIYSQFFHETRFRPSSMMQTRLEGGLLGRKVGEGYYTYEGGKQNVPEEAPAPSYDGRPVWISQAEPVEGKLLADLIAGMDANIDSGARPGKDSMILVTPIGADATTAAVEQDLDPKRTLAVDTLFGLTGRRTVMRTPLTEDAFTRAAHGLMASDGTPATVINDSPGFIAQRIIAMIVNIGCSIAQAGTASPDDIDKAVKLGLGYPRGPLDFGDALGPAKILKVLSEINRLTADPRYRPTPWLRRRAQLGVSLLTPED